MQRIIAVIASVIIFSSCSNRYQSDGTFSTAAAEGLTQSNATIFSSTNIIYRELERKLTNPICIQQAKIWEPKTVLIKEKSAVAIKYIDSLIFELEREAGMIEKNGKLILNPEGLNSINRLFINKKIGEELRQKLRNYKQDIMAIDYKLQNQFGQSSIVVTREFDFDTNKQKEFSKIFFDQVSVINAIAMLRKFENNIRVIEINCVTYCNYQVPENDESITVFSTLVAQSSNSVKAGDKIEIVAGVGAFSVKSKPEITINGKVFPEGTFDAVANYKFTTPLKTGKYFIPVKIEYTDDYGQRQMRTEKVEYTVIE